MEMFSDDFISYNNEMNVKLEKSSDHDISLDSPSLKTCESTPNLYPVNFSPNLQNLLIRSVSIGGMIPKKNQPFTIIKAKKETVEDHLEVKIESEDKILNKSKLIMKREKAKQRAMTRLNKPIYLKLEADVESEAPESTPISGEPKNKKKVLQMIRNRISAQTSRDRKKAYLYQLEDTKCKLNSENSSLKQQNTSLLQEVAKLKEANKKLNQQNQQYKSKQGFDSLEVEQTEDDFGSTFGNKQNSFETIMKNVANSANSKAFEGLSQDKNRLNDICSFATILSTLVVNQFNNDNHESDMRMNGSQIQEEVENLMQSSDKFDLRSVFSKIHNDEKLLNYTSDFINDKQNTIFSHLSEMTKTDKKSFSRASKENYPASQQFYSLTNFDLADNGAEYGTLKDIKQEDSQFTFGIKTSNLL